VQIVETPYVVYEKTVYEDRTLIRQFHRWTAWAATRDGRLLILLDEYVRRRVTVCTYDDAGERESDIRVLLSISEVIVPPGTNGGGTPPPVFVSAWKPVRN
jgi:hypothetical protein